MTALAVLLRPFPVFSQAPGSEEDVIRNADAAFDKADYAKAMPLYSQLLANHPADPNYNYKYGVCVLYASSEKDKALPFLEKASADPKADADVWFYLGKAYHLNYQFDQAIVAYTKYKQLVGEKKAEKMQVDNQIAMCKTGRKLLKAITDITVLEKAELNEQDFYKHYDLKSAGYSGQLLAEPDEFKTALDKKKGVTSIIYLSGEKSELYFSSYGDDESQGKDIYVVRRLPNQKWGKPQNVGYPINTEYDEDYPFLMPDGKVLYFSSKGHNSMGGYDVFRAELNEETNTWEKPVNLDFAINSPDDDIMFVSDANEQTAWFASNRNSPEGKMTVYHVVIQRKPVQNCMISGTFVSTDGDPNEKAKITVKNEDTNEPIGVYTSNQSSGSYFMNLPNNGGKYSFTVEHSGIHTQTQTVIIPPQYEIKTVNQRIHYVDVNGDQQLVIETDFSSDTSTLDPLFLKDKAKLDVNSGPDAYQVVDMGNPDNAGKNPGNTTDPDNSNVTDPGDDPSDSIDPADSVPSSNAGKVTDAELVKSAYDDANATKAEAEDMQNQANNAYAYAADLDRQAKAMQDSATNAKKAADAMADGPDKVAATKRADDLQAQANSLQSQTVAAFNVAQAMDTDAQNKKNEADKTQQYAASLDKAVKSNDPKALDQAQKQADDLQQYSVTTTQKDQTVQNISKLDDQKHADLKKAQDDLDLMQADNKDNYDRIAQLQKDKDKEKDKDLRAGYDDQIQGLKDDIDDNNAKIAKQQAYVNSLQNDVNDLDNQLHGVTQAAAQPKTNTGAVVSPQQKKDL
ncbi:MAG TPA: carboxypeptidase regulatory-like domain-containing protein, partial [Bacteroidia bacterium]|nr:carboxypeptidase regulatory-like domain-containing protein [Bacteroidia bacterium]